MTARLPSKLVVSAFLRQVQAEGGHGMVLAKGDPDAGAILIEARDRGQFSGVFERVIGPYGSYRWQRVGPQDDGDDSESSAYILRRQQNDPDLWVIELDIPSPQRLIALWGGDA